MPPRLDTMDPAPPPFWRSRAGIALLVVCVVGGFLLLTEHRAEVLGVLPYAFLMACPLMHMFMHHGHHGHHGHHHHQGDHGRTGRASDERIGQ